MILISDRFSGQDLVSMVEQLLLANDLPYPSPVTQPGPMAVQCLMTPQSPLVAGQSRDWTGLDKSPEDTEDSHLTANFTTNYKSDSNSAVQFTHS